MKKNYLCPQLTNSVNMKRIWNTFCEEISKKQRHKGNDLRERNSEEFPASTLC
jgi:hypothetical protein